MKFKARYTGTDLSKSASVLGLEVVRRTVSIDVGLVNLGICRLAFVRDKVTKTTRYILEHSVVIDLTTETSRSIDTAGQNLFKMLNGTQMQWMWSPPCPIVTERQVDQLQINAAKNTRYKPPINFAIYGMLMQIVFAHRAPMSFLDDDAWQELDQVGVDPTDAKFERKELEWQPASGCQKSELKGVREEDRKTETLIRAPRLARVNKDTKAADFFEGLAKPKPREDACDAYLQAHFYLNNLERDAQKVVRKAEREVAHKRKAEAIEDKRKAKRARLMPQAGASPSNGEPFCASCTPHPW